MISFKQFVNAIQDAIISARDAIMDKNVSMLDKYFTESGKVSESGKVPESAKAPESGKPPSPDAAAKTTMIPKSVLLEYPHLTSDGAVQNLEIAVPLITLVPLSTTQLDKAVLSANFEMEVIDGELQLHFSDSSTTGLFNKKPKTAWGKIELTFSPQETSEGFKLLVAGYEEILKRQLA